MSPQRDQPNTNPDLADLLVGVSHNMQEVREQIIEYSQTDSNVLILGETGTGKEIIANEIHNRSSRATNDMVTVRITELPPTLIEGELFGYKRGAHSEAKTTSPGRIAQADGSTLFLDEIGDLPYDLQPKLFGPTYTKVIWPLGAQKSVKINFRLISATSQPIDEQTKKQQSQRFRIELFRRLSQVIITVEPVRERREDILPSVKHFLSPLEVSFNKLHIHWVVLYSLLTYSWPTNVAEIETICTQDCWVEDKDKKLILFNTFRRLPLGSFNNDKYDLPPPLVDADEDCWGSELVNLEEVNQEIQQRVTEVPFGMSTDPLITTVLVDLAKRLVSMPKYERARQRYEQEKKREREESKVERRPKEWEDKQRQNERLKQALENFRFPPLSPIDEAINTLIKEGMKLPDLTKRFIERFLLMNPVTDKKGEKPTSRAKQLGIDPKTVRKHLSERGKLPKVVKRIFGE